ncbi:hypothetical protein BD410DRAFT_803848 [Rickenella mellea]|uniref:DUF6532 domain-containing protein n=1 Tax=Rickenella mellea TaxID=50990 RepID=A0A4Y7Q303_9AGAM|nr:hypothetical protein BD410DRAFT_803848 [Rickenella mellea]
MAPRGGSKSTSSAAAATSRSKNASSRSTSDASNEVEILRKKIALLEKEKKLAEKSDRKIRQKAKAVMRAEDSLYSDEEEAEVENDPEANKSDRDDPPQSRSVNGHNDSENNKENADQNSIKNNGLDVQRSPQRNATIIPGPFNIVESTNPSTPPRPSATSSNHASPHSGKSNDGSAKKSKKATLKSLTPRSRVRVKPANKLFRVLMATQNAFPNAEGRNTMALEAFADGKSKKDGDREMKMIKKDPDYADRVIYIITQGTSQLHGEIKTKCANAIGGHYQIPGSRNPADLKKFVAWLLADSNFAFGGLDLANQTRDNQKPYMHPIIAEILQKQWFSSKRAEGYKFREKFNPIPLALIAIIVTGVEAALQDWKEGQYSRTDFTTDLNAPRWDHHVSGLRKLKEKANNWTANLQKKMFIDAWQVVLIIVGSYF